MGKDEAEEEPIFYEPIFDDPDDDLGRVILVAKINCGSEKKRLKLEKMLEDHNKVLYPNCEDGKKKLGTTLELLQWKTENGTSDKGFEKLLKIIKKMLPGENVSPSSTYEAKKVVCPLGLEVQKIHAYIKDCILYREEYENLNACPVCGALRYKIMRDDPGNVEGESTPRKRVPPKEMWYAPIIPWLKRLFQNKEHAKLLRWHKEDRKKDVILRHPADGSQWRKIDREFKLFSDDARNLRFGLSTDGFNPFGEQSSNHSTWLVTLWIYNLPPWLCMKRKFIMISVLIQGPRQPDNDIDVYLRTLVEELLQLWREEGVPVWYDGGSQKGSREEPRGRTTGGAAQGLPRHLCSGAPPLSPFLRLLLRPENLSHERTSRRVTAASAGGEHQRERALRRAGIRRGNSLPEGEIDAIAIVIERDIISIIIIIISTIYTAITTAAPRHRCSNSG
ncbi:hypothetical protein QYE76_048923 [Lolium multiflorum]|uniref:Transposon protein, putative, CACTA, En/Spm sub-class n=1 Tax=Lolium multiflorum TaxID=4521 RepID=A0AAD8SNB1_LOLMU|nr:hypothetical protein QYE76_048923 [Lolium multiflorum]